MNDLLTVVERLAPVLGVVSVVVGALLAGWLQWRVTRSQMRIAHQSQLDVLKTTHLHDLEMMAAQRSREDEQRTRQFAEADRADRQVVVEYIDLLLPRLCEVASIHYLAADNRDTEELERYLTLQRHMQTTALDAAHPERNPGVRMTFLLFQLVAAMRLALNARWARPLTAEQTSFLAHWESHLEPILCSGRYPGKELLYREQLEVISDEMLVVGKATGRPRPIHWKEFCDKLHTDATFLELVNLVAVKLRFIFVETNALPPRKAMQCRLAIMALYLAHISHDAGDDYWARREPALWNIVCGWFRTERDVLHQSPEWFVFERGDVASRLA